MTAPDWHGWSTRLGDIHVGRLPGRKQVCLYTNERPPGGGAVLHVLAFFRTEEDAERCLAYLDALADTPGAAS